MDLIKILSDLAQSIGPVLFWTIFGVITVGIIEIVYFLILPSKKSKAESWLGFTFMHKILACIFTLIGYVTILALTALGVILLYITLGGVAFALYIWINKKLAEICTDEETYDESRKNYRFITGDKVKILSSVKESESIDNWEYDSDEEQQYIGKTFKVKSCSKNWVILQDLPIGHTEWPIKYIKLVKAITEEEYNKL